MTAIGRGSKVKCIKRGPWKDNRTGETYEGPTYGSVWTVDHLYKDKGCDYLVLVGDRNGFGRNASQFIPLDGNEDITALQALLTAGDPDAKQKQRAKETAL